MTFLPDFNAAAFSDSTTIDNDYFPLPEGTILSYEGTVIDPESGEEESERFDQFVTSESSKTIEGVYVVVVRDTAYEDGVLVEDTLDWYAQDDFGNVWYLGEIATNYNYDDDGNFIGTDFDGSWESGVDGAVPGWIMEVDPMVGDSYFQEFYEGVAEDEGEVISTNESVTVGGILYTNVVKIEDTSSFEPDVGAFKYYAPGIGMVTEEEFAFGETELVIDLTNDRFVDDSAEVDPADLAFAGDGTEMTITFLSEDASMNTAIGAYTFDTATGEIGEGRILFVDTEDTEAGATATMMVGAGESLGLFLVPNADDLGIELEDYLDGGLFFGNYASGYVADVYDGDPNTTYTPGVATIYDVIAPVVMDTEGNLLPIQPYHSVGNREGYNFLNSVAGENALESDAGDSVPGVDVISFEDGLASTEDFDGDFDDAFVAVSAAPLSEENLEALLDEIDISRIVGSDGNDEIEGTEDDDQIIGLEGNDQLLGEDGDDIIEASDGNDHVYGGDGDDEITGEDGNDRLFGDAGEDEIDGGDGNDWLFGGGDDDLLDGGDGADKLDGGDGYDMLLGGEGNDNLIAGGDGARMAGGAGSDKMIGEAGSADTFVFNLSEFGNDVIYGFENNLDLIEIATYTGVSGFGDIEVEQLGKATVLSFADGSVKIDDFDADLVDATNFAFV